MGQNFPLWWESVKKKGFHCQNKNLNKTGIAWSEKFYLKAKIQNFASEKVVIAGIVNWAVLKVFNSNLKPQIGSHDSFYNFWVLGGLATFRTQYIKFFSRRKCQTEDEEF